MKTSVLILIGIVLASPAFSQGNDLPSDKELEEMNKILLGTAADYEASLRELEGAAEETAAADDARRDLFSAIARDDLPSVKAMEAAGADLFAVDPMDRYSTLMHAAGNGALSVTKYLVSRGLPLQARTHEGDTPIMIAVALAAADRKPSGAERRKRKAEVVRYLITPRAKGGAGLDGNAEVVSDTGNRISHCAALEGNVEALAALRDCGVDLDAQNAVGRTAFQYAAGEGYLEAVRYLATKGGIDIRKEDFLGTNAYDSAEAKGEGEVARYLASIGLGHGTLFSEVDREAAEERAAAAESEADGSALATELNGACAEGNLAEVRALVEKRHADPNRFEGNSSPLIAAVLANSAEIVRYLVSKGARVDAAQEEGFTPLCMACMGGAIDAARALLNSGADPNRACGDTAPLELARATENAELIALLKSKGAR